MILGTAGHVDHGKTALVKALTGVDTDRLAEEKRRGITIELGFAPLRIGDRTIGVVDVPGHEAFVRTMVAGATGVDLALLVVAADEGVMPQTREHLQILTLLGTRAGVVALTKCDLVDADFRALVAEDVVAALAGTPLEGAPIVPVSVVTGEGLDALRTAIAQAADRIPLTDEPDLFRLPIDRAFTVKGTGTVVTGTVWSGSLRREDTVRVLPAGLEARVRGIESHGASVDAALPGTRAAIALAGVDLADVARGATLVTGEGWQPSRVLLGKVAFLGDDPRPPGPRTWLRFHLGTQEAGVRVVWPASLRAGGGGEARLMLDAPIVARAGDRFILRGGPALTTIGGGTVTDPAPSPRARPLQGFSSVAEARLLNALVRAGVRGLPESELPVRIGASPAASARAVKSIARLLRAGGVLYAPPVVVALQQRMRDLVDRHHAAHPLQAGAPLQSVRERLGVRAELMEAVLAEQGSALVVDGPVLRRPDFKPALDDGTRARVVEILRAAGREPPSVQELDGALGRAAAPILRLLEKESLVVQVEPARWYARESVNDLVARLRDGTTPGREYSPAELRDLLGFSRKFLIPFLEWCDRQGITSRRATGRTVAPADAPGRQIS